MFESDDFDKVLSQFDFPEISNSTQAVANDEENDVSFKDHSTEFLNTNTGTNTVQIVPSKPLQNVSNNSYKLTSDKIDDIQFASTKALSGDSNKKDECFVSPKHTKRKIINSHFDHKSKRKFPGPAGLLNGTLKESNNETIGHMQLLSQDIEYTEHQHRDFFGTPLWMRLLNDIKCSYLGDVDPIQMIKEQTPEIKARTVTGFVETVYRSNPDPQITLRDTTGHIKCTLHRDAWSAFSPYIVPEYCALILWKPSVLTRGGAIKKRYLNITLSNLYAIYSSAVLKDDNIHLPEGYTMTCEEGYTIIKTEKSPQSRRNPFEDETSDLLDDLGSIFSDDPF